MPKSRTVFLKCEYCCQFKVGIIPCFLVGDKLDPIILPCVDGENDGHWENISADEYATETKKIIDKSNSLTNGEKNEA